MKNKKNNTDMISTNHIGRNTKLLLICFLLLTSFLLSSCLSDHLIKDLQREINDYRRIQALTSAVDEEFGTMSMYRMEIDDEAKSFVLAYGGPNTIAEYDKIRVIINNFLLENPDFFLNDGYSIEICIQGNHAGPVMLVLSNEKKLDNGSDDALYVGLDYMKVYDMSDDIAISQMKGHCTTLKALLLDKVALDDLDALKDLPALESVELLDGYTEEDLQAIREALPNCEVTWRE